MSNRERRRAEKVKILRLHLLEHKPVSEVCEEQGIHPTLFYKWQKEFFENGAAAFERHPHSSTGTDYQKEVTDLKAKGRVLSAIRAHSLSPVISRSSSASGRPRTYFVHLSIRKVTESWSDFTERLKNRPYGPKYP